ncbi:unnamed protein product [Angiostrongylus costaricensis]|uniref:Non-specific serine/threonine protein kinase n=1 Tax=Angiostrongylus costaricensis TaxID=334426 RepID=A0A0R3P9U9_ANGCS|nr:unnamed protein product [Angiostrongylus costaricensis]
MELYLRNPRSASSNPKVSGTLITHLHEHTDKVTQLAVQPDRTRFASASLDGSVLLWNSRNAVGDGYGAVRSEASFVFNRSTNINDGHVLWVDSGSSEPRIVTKVNFITSNEGSPEQIHVSNNITYVRSHHGMLYCLDLRVGRTNGSLGFHEVWRREVVKYHDHNVLFYVTSSCIDPTMENWMVMCSTNKELMLWDLRFRVQVNAWKTPHGLLPLRLWSNPLSSTVIVSIFLQGEIFPFSFIHVLLPFFNHRDNYFKDDLRNVSTALCVCEDTGFVYTGDSEGSLRRWNLNWASLCEYITRSPCRIAYNEMAGSAGQPTTIFELRVPNEHTKLRSFPDLKSQASTRHRTSVSDVLCLESDILVSASADGVIKIWK